MTIGFAESTAALSMTVLGASDLAGKLLLSGIADYLPFPKMFLFHIASTSGIAMMFAVINIKSVVAIFSSSVGKKDTFHWNIPQLFSEAMHWCYTCIYTHMCVGVGACACKKICIYIGFPDQIRKFVIQIHFLCIQIRPY